MQFTDARWLLSSGVVDAELAALLWLLAEGGVPVVVTGQIPAPERAKVAAAVLTLVPDRAWTVVDLDADPISTDDLAAFLRGGVGLGLVQEAPDLRTWLDRAVAAGLPEDGVRRLGVVLVLVQTERGLRCEAVHYLRPSERDGQGHVQRRPPAVLAALDADTDRLEHYAWGITPELADRVDRSQADLEDRQRDRASVLERLAGSTVTQDEWDSGIASALASEPARVPAPEHAPAAPSEFTGGLTDPDPHTH